MRKRGFEPQLSALVAGIPYLSLWGFEPSTCQSCTSEIFLIALERESAPQSLSHSITLIFAGISASNRSKAGTTMELHGTKTKLAHGGIGPRASSLLRRRLIRQRLRWHHRRIKPLPSRMTFRDYTTQPPVITDLSEGLMLIVVPQILYVGTLWQSTLGWTPVLRRWNVGWCFGSLARRAIS